jgi:hypothetical protein
MADTVNKGGRPRTTTGSGPTVRIEADLQSMLKYIAARRGVPIAKLTSDLIRPVVEREFMKLAPKLDRAADEGN